MPIVAHSSLPTFRELGADGEAVLGAEESRGQDIRELHIGLLNMMPDDAFRVTERQFIRLLGSSNQIVQMYVHPFTVPGLDRNAATQAHIDEHYESLDQVKADGLDALVVTGANVSNPHLQDEPFWAPLQDVMEWADQNVTSVLCSCLATHALLQHAHGIHRRRMQTKRWGVYVHRAVQPDHPLLRGTNTRFDVPHSRWNEITTAQVRQAGLEVLIESEEGDFHLGTSPDGIRAVYLQGHPEYDTVSLLKEYKRELTRYLAGDLDAIPPYPQNYLPSAAAHRLHDHLDEAIAARDAGTPLPDFPDAELAALLDNTWTDTARAIFNNWLGIVYRLTSMERGVPFMPGVDPDDPLGRIAAGNAPT